MYNLQTILNILIEREEEEKQKARDNWTVSEFAFHNGKCSAFKDILLELEHCTK